MKMIVKRILAVICVCVLFVGCGEGFRYILVDDTNSYTRLTMHQLYHSKENIDVLFVGSSHVYRSIIPEIVDEEIGAYTFNAGTSSQYMDGSLAIIKEAIEYNDISRIYLEMYYAVVTGDVYKERTQLTSTYIISDYMKPSLRKVDYLLHAGAKEHWVNGFIVPRRYWTKMFDIDYIINLVQKKNTDSYKNYEWIKAEGQTEYYVDRGFVASEGVVAEDNYWNASAYGPIEVGSITEDTKESLGEIIRLCKKRGIELTMFVVPMPEWTLVGKGNYDEYINAVTDIAMEGKVEFYDFNLCKVEYFAASNQEYFKDYSHLNTVGAKKFSKLFGEFLSGKIAKKDLFYSSYMEKLANEEPMVYGVTGKADESETSQKHVRVISNRDKGTEYKVVVMPEEGEERVVQDFSENKEFEIPIDEHGMMRIIWRSSNETENAQIIEFTY